MNNGAKRFIIIAACILLALMIAVAAVLLKRNKDKDNAVLEPTKMVGVTLPEERPSSTREKASETESQQETTPPTAEESRPAIQEPTPLETLYDDEGNARGVLERPAMPGQNRLGSRGQNLGPDVQPIYDDAELILDDFGFIAIGQNPYEGEVLGPEHPFDVDPSIPRKRYPVSTNFGRTGVFLGEAGRMTTAMREELLSKLEDTVVASLVLSDFPTAEDGYTSDPSKQMDGDTPNPYYSMVLRDELETFIAFEIESRINPGFKPNYKYNIHPMINPEYPGEVVRLEIFPEPSSNVGGEGDTKIIRVQYHAFFEHSGFLTDNDSFYIVISREEGIKCLEPTDVTE